MAKARKYKRDRRGRFSGGATSGGTSGRRKRGGRHAGAFQPASSSPVTHETFRAGGVTLEGLQVRTHSATGGGAIRGIRKRARSNKAAHSAASKAIKNDPRIAGVIARNEAKTNAMLARIQR